VKPYNINIIIILHYTILNQMR